MSENPPNSRMQKFLFKSSAVAFRGSIRKPYFQDLGTHAALETHAGSAGRGLCRSQAFQLGDDVRYDLAQTDIVARSTRNIFQTVVTTRVEGLKVRDILSVGAVVCRLESVYDLREYPRRKYARISPAGSSFEKLVIAGKEQKISLPPAFTAEKTVVHDFFEGKYDDKPDYFPGRIPAPLYLAGVGAFYFAEWAWVHPDERFRQSLTMLRFTLGSDFGASMECAMSAGDGSGWPP